jgi:signal transduction histidine kinase/CheY-like chemotaxis protein
MRLIEKEQNGTIRVLQRLIVVGLLLPFLLFAVAAWKDQETLLQTAEKDSVKIVALFREQVGNLFAGHQLLLDLTFARVRDMDWETIRASKNLLNEIEEVDRSLDGVSEILLVDASGRVGVTTIPLRANEPPPAADGPCFMALSQNGNEHEHCISRPYLNPESGHFLFALSRRLEKDGIFNGTLQVAVSADQLVGLWTAATDASDIVTMFGEDGTVLAQTQPMSQPLPGQIAIGKTLIGQIGGQETGTIEAPLLLDGGNWITVYSKVANNPVYIALSRNKKAIMAAWYANLAIYGLITVSAAVGILAALGIALRQAKSERRSFSHWQAEIEQREKAQEQLRHSQRMEGLGKLTGGIAHDFNNLLTAIIGNICMAQEVAPGAKPQEYLSSAMRAGEKAVTLTQRLLAFARKQVLQPKSVDIPSLVEGMQSLLLQTVGQDVRVEVSSDIQPWPAHVDPNQIEMVILNLAVNARDAMPHGGSLSFTTTNHEFGPDLPPELTEGQYVLLTVSDTGVGMDEATLARAMEPFFSTREVGRGTGLGLSMMQGVVTQSGGTARMRSKLGHGTQVEIWLPRAHTDPMAAAIRKVHDDRQESGVILVCDDDLAVLAFVCAALRAKGYEVLSTTSGRMAITMLDENEEIDLLLIDYTMPEMNGEAVIRKVNISHPWLPILLMTGNADPEAIQVDLPDIAMLLKPFYQEELTERVSGLLASDPDKLYDPSDVEAASA